MGKDSSFIGGLICGGALIGLGMAVSEYFRKGKLSDSTGRAVGHASGNNGKRGNTGADISGDGTGSGDFGGYVAPIDRSSFYRAASAVRAVNGGGRDSGASCGSPGRTQGLIERLTGR